jgi:RimJ/RimL family protein N-acetyltransferase
MYPVRLSTDRLGLRELTVDDVDAVHAVYGSPQATEHLSFEPRSRDQVGLIVARAMTAAVASPRTEYALAACTRDGDVIGYARLALDPLGQRAATIGFALRPDVWGVGYGTETVRALLTLGFDHLGLHRIWAARSPLNEPSRRALERAGLLAEGRVRDHVHVRGAWRDSVVHSILEDEWRSTGDGPRRRGDAAV